MRLRHLFEEANRVLYHATSVWAFAKMIQEGRIGLTYATGSDIHAGAHNEKKMFFLSTTRSKVGNYSVVAEGGSGSVVLVLNADYLSRNLQIRPVDYWGREFRKVDPKRNEMEERVYSTSPYIAFPPTPADLIMSAHIMLREPDERIRAYLISILKASKAMGIPIYAYDQKRAWLLQDTRRALPGSKIIEIIRAIPPKPPGGGGFRLSSRYGGYVELFKRQPADRERLTKQGRYVLRNLTPWGVANGDAFNSLNAEIHGDRAASSLHHQQLLAFLEFLRQNRYSNIRDFLAHLSQKWYPEN